IKPQESINMNFIISVGEEKEEVLNNLQKFNSVENIKNEFKLSKARIEAESRYLGIKGKDIENYQKMLGYIIFDDSVKSVISEKLNKREYRQSDLWKYGISGDIPIILVKIQNVNDIYCIKEILKAYEFFKTKNIKTEVVILDE